MSETMIQLVPFFAMLAVFYFLLIRPQVKEKEAHDAMVAGLTKDDRVVTRGGMHGRVHSVGDETLQLEVAKGVRIEIDKDAVARKADAAKA